MTEPLRFSDLKEMGKSPLHYRHRAERAQTSSMEKGSALHAIVYQTQPVVAFPGKQRRGTDWNAFLAAHPGELILTGSAYESAFRMAEAVWTHPEAKELLLGAGVVCEQTLHFDYLGTAARGTPDTRHPSRVVELKSAKTSQPDRLMWQCKTMSYHAQLAFYRHGVQKLGLGDAPEAYVVAVESSAPWPVTVLRLTDRTLEQGERLCRLWYERLRACQDADAWPPYVQSAVEWDLGDDEDIGLVFADEADNDGDAEAA